MSSDLFMNKLGYIHIKLDTFENASFSQSFGLLYHTETMLFLRENLWLFLDFILHSCKYD